MLPVKIILVDDEPGILLLLRSILCNIEGALVVGIAENANDAMELVKDQSPDLAFLDIELPDIKGIELAQKLRQKKPELVIVFVTAHQEYSLDAFKLYAVDYILKPIDEERVKETFRRIQKMLTMSKQGEPNPQSAIISINYSNQQVFIKLSDIYYIEKAGRYTVFYCVNGKIKSRDILQELERRLGITFFRSHKSYIINLMKVERIISYSNYYEVEFKDFKGKAWLSRDRYKQFTERLKNTQLVR